METIKISDFKKGLTIGFVLALVLLICTNSYFYQSDKIVERLESYLYFEDLPTTISKRINENTTIHEIRKFYEAYPNLAKELLRVEVSLICGR